MKGALGIEAGGIVNLNGATLNITSSNGAIAGTLGKTVNGAILDGGEMNMNGSSIIFSSSIAAATASGVAGVDLVDGGRFTMQGSGTTASAIGNAAARKSPLLRCV